MLSRRSCFNTNNVVRRLHSASSSVPSSSQHTLFLFGGGGATTIRRSFSSLDDGYSPIEGTKEPLACLAAEIPPRFMKWSDFEALCKKYKVQEKPRDVASRLAKCGAVIVSDDGVHGHAPQAIRDACEAMGEPWNPVADLEKQADTLRKEIKDLRPAYEQQLAQAVSARRTTWSGAFAFTGVQLAVFSRLTYFDLDWDTMEPISYFLGSGISVLAFCFMLVRGFDFNNREIDREVVRKKYLNKPEVVNYFDRVEKLERIEKEIEVITTWVRTGKMRS